MSSISQQRNRYSEPIQITLIRTIVIALSLGTLIFLLTKSHYEFSGTLFQYWASWVISVFWFSFGGHWVEIAYLNYVRMSLPKSRWLETVIRLLVWFVGGSALFVGMKATADPFGNSILEALMWWHGGVLFIIVELIIHTILAGLRKNFFWNGRG